MTFSSRAAPSLSVPSVPATHSRTALFPVASAHHVVVGGVGGIVEVILADQLHSLLHGVGVVQDQPQHGGGGQVGLVGVLVRGDGLLPLVGHVDAAADPGVVHAVQGDIGSRQTDDLVHQLRYVCVHVDAQELEIHGGHRGVTAVAGIGEDQTGVGLAEVVVPGKEAAAVLGLGGEGGAADLRSLQADVDKPLGQVAGDEGDKVAVAGAPPWARKSSK